MQDQEIMQLFLKIEQATHAPIPVMTTDRHIPRKEQARLARELFKKLGLKGISVTTPSYSMASSVDVRVPTITKTEADYGEHKHACFSDMPDTVPAKMKNTLEWEAKKHVQHILTLAFPKHDDRSDYQSDHFDSKWSL